MGEDGKTYVLPDGSGFMTVSFPLPEGHWFNQRDADGFVGDPPKGDTRDALRWAIKAATDCGRITDYDPDAIVQNFFYALRFRTSFATPTAPTQTEGSE